MYKGKFNCNKIILIGFIVFQLVGCSDPEFSQKPPNLITQSTDPGKVDILFIVDNSGSMYVEQVKMANSFPAFLSGLEINDLDYRIAITTTDVSSSNNPKKVLGGLTLGALQDGRLIKFPNGQLFLDSKSENIENQFRATIQRNETLNCEGGRFEVDKCPSSDERGIYAANLAVKRNESGFFRSGSHIVFIFLSDEDVRGAGLSNPERIKPQLGDYPETLIDTVLTDLGPSHTISSHSVVVESESCRQSQLYQNNNENILARIGYFYMRLSTPSNPTVLTEFRSKGISSIGQLANGKLLQGTVGSICSSNYTSQIGSILNVLVQDSRKMVSKIDLDCKPEADTFKVEKCPRNVSCELNKEQTSVLFNPPLNPNQTSSVSYLCYQ